MRIMTEEQKEKIRQAHLARKADLMNQICEMAKEGKTAKEIASHFGKRVSNINKILHNRNVESVRPPSPYKGISTNPEKIIHICEMAMKGKTAQEIADHYNELGFNHSAGHIYKILNGQGIFLDRIKPNANPERIKQICDMFNQGTPIKDIANHFNYKSNTYVYRVLAETGIREPEQISDPDRIKQICNMRKQGMPLSQISQYFGYSGTGYVSRICTENGLRSRKPNRTDGYTLSSQGYLFVRIQDDDPMVSMRSKNGRILEHRLNMARKLGRPLTKDEIVHHINGIKTDNRPENLQLQKAFHGKGRVMKCSLCHSEDVNTIGTLKCNKCNSTQVEFTEM